MAKNHNLHNAKKQQEDEFYTTLETIQDELRHYRKHFRDKTVLCNCDDPYESWFFKYFALNFNFLGLKKLIATCYAGSPIAGEQMSIFDQNNEEEITKKPYKITITEVGDVTGNGAFDISDVEWLIQNDKNVLTELEGDGDFRSEECLKLLNEADIVVTNPPFSKFREYTKLLMKYKKKFLIIGNQNAITYKEIFPLLKDNKIWLGYHFGDMKFCVPDYYEPRKTRYWVDETGQKWRSLGNACWFTNLDIKKRHENLPLYKFYSPSDYPKYDNYDAIEVSKVAEIPEDYEECLLVPTKYKQELIDAGYEVGYERLNSKGEPCISLSLSLSGKSCSPERDGILQRHNGRADNISRQIQSESIRDNGTGSLCKGKSETGSQIRDKWKRKICSYLDSPSELEYCSGVMGVPITFLDKYNPEQFEIIGHPQSGILPNGWKGVCQQFVDLYYEQGNKGAIREGWINPVYVTEYGQAVIPYQRILVRKNNSKNRSIGNYGD